MPIIPIIKTGAAVDHVHTDVYDPAGSAATALVAAQDYVNATADTAATIKSKIEAAAEGSKLALGAVNQNVFGAPSFQKAITGIVYYVKTTTGAPVGVAGASETCLNLFEAKLYTYTTVWDAGVAVAAGNRYVHGFYGIAATDTTGDSGAYTFTGKIYTVRSANVYEEYTPVLGAITCIADYPFPLMYSGTIWNYLGYGVFHDNTNTKLGNGTYHLSAAEAGRVTNSNAAKTFVGAHTVTAGEASANQVDLDTGFAAAPSVVLYDVYRAGVKVTADAIMSRLSAGDLGKIRIADGGVTYNTTENDVIELTAYMV
jgi:hypothetical protein